jgi:hypothetical protein
MPTGPNVALKESESEVWGKKKKKGKECRRVLTAEGIVLLFF